MTLLHLAHHPEGLHLIMEIGAPPLVNQRHFEPQMLGVFLSQLHPTRIRRNHDAGAGHGARQVVDESMQSCEMVEGR